MVVSQGGIVATSQVLASQAGASILDRGGSAVDAAIAANAVLGMTEPMMNGVGGDLLAIIWDAKAKKLYGLNSAGWSPKGLSIPVLKSKGIDGRPPLHSIHFVTVPGAVAGWEALQKKFGKLTLAQLLAPAIYYADQGRGADRRENPPGPGIPTARDCSMCRISKPHSCRAGMRQWLGRFSRTKIWRRR